MIQEGLLLVISGPSGAGKGTVCRGVLDKNKDIYISISATTRKPRPGELDGVNYHFKTTQEFKKMMAENQLLEYALVYDNYYGTPRQEVMETLKQGKDVILEIDIQGALQVKDNMPRAVLIFIVPPSLEELRKRLIQRGTDTLEEIEKRLKCVKDELKYVSRYGYIILNDQVEEAIKKVEAIITAEKCRPWYYNFDDYA
ncbi:guanylate kinase [Desulfolucanica intricata]|uniref:guanylate kinase n=1 Tax=Desulfolucanica intricata TaxID=1285191 RepID=UPI00082EE150|nr:guanylate kinase [Desulfolucanica intricata]